MRKQQTTTAYPVPHEGFTRATAAVEAAAERLNRHAEVVGTQAAKLEALTAAKTAADRALASAELAAVMRGEAAALAEATALVFGDSPERTAAAHATPSDIELLERAANDARENVARFDRQAAALETLGASLSAELDEAVKTLATERATYAYAIRDTLAERIAESARDMAGHRAAYEAFVQAAGMPSIPTAWLEVAHVSDPREAVLLGHYGAFYDHAPNLLKQAGPYTESAVQAITASLEQLAAAKRLVNTPRPQPSSNAKRPASTPRQKPSSNPEDTPLGVRARVERVRNAQQGAA